MNSTQEEFVEPLRSLKENELLKRAKPSSI